MKNKNGFTLVELLAVIAILAILVIIALPNVMGMFNTAKKNSFTTEVKQIYKTAQQEWMNDSLFSTDEQEYVRCATCSGKSLDLTGRKELEYYIRFNKAGNVVEYYATDGTYQFGYYGDGLLITDITEVDQVSELDEGDIITITGYGGGLVETPTGPVSFATDSWNTISDAIKDNNTSAYHVGDTKQIDMGSLGTHTVRITNMSTPSECNDESFSKTACGFVVEFADVVVEHRMNPYEQSGRVNGDGNKGGWEYCEARQYLNTTVYDSLPVELKRIIIDTYAVSGAGGDETGNFYTTDKLYLLSKVEVNGDTTHYSNFYDNTYSRAMDYYAGYSSNKSIAIKKYNDQAKNWCLRTADKGQGTVNYRAFWGVRSSDGFIAEYNSCTALSPAFRIGIRQ